jgi:hypothetical protein
MPQPTSGAPSGQSDELIFPSQRRNENEVSATLGTWDNLKESLTSLFATASASEEWLTNVEALATRIRALYLRDPDLALYVLLQSAVSDLRHYNSHHSIFAAVVSDLCATWLEWPTHESTSLFNAAVTMNISMAGLQNQLAQQDRPPTQQQRRVIDEHPAAGAALLEAAGVSDKLWLEIVRGHHTPVPASESRLAPVPAQRLAQLLRRADIFTAKLSKRRSREGRSGAIAARDACLDATGQLDEIGATMLRVLGLYPPGSCVQIANGELAIVTRRGNKAHQPTVVAVRRADGSTLVNLKRRECGEMQFNVVRVVKFEELNMFLQHNRILACG